jgi:hypothetical protein
MRVLAIALACPNGLAYSIKRNISAADHKVVIEAQNPIALRVQPCIARSVMKPLLFSVVRRAIEFNDESIFDAQKIDNIRSDRNLPAKFQPVE